MADLTTIQLLHTADPTVAPAINEKYGELKADENGALWIRPITEIGGGIGIRTARVPNKDDIDPDDTNDDGSNEPIIAFDSLGFNHIFNNGSGFWDRDYKTADFNGVENISVAAVDTVLKTQDFNRKYLLIQNTHDTDKIFINFNGAANNQALVIEAGQNYEPLIVPVSAINAIAENEATNVIVVTA